MQLKLMVKIREMRKRQQQAVYNALWWATIVEVDFVFDAQGTASDRQRKVFTTPLLSEVKKRRNTKQFTKKKPRCHRGGVHGVANQNATTERTNVANRTMLQRRSRGSA